MFIQEFTFCNIQTAVEEEEAFKSVIVPPPQPVRTEVRCTLYCHNLLHCMLHVQ